MKSKCNMKNINSLTGLLISRQSFLTTRALRYAATVALLLCLGFGNVWGTEIYSAIVYSGVSSNVSASDNNLHTFTSSQATVTGGSLAYCATSGSPTVISTSQGPSGDKKKVFALNSNTVYLQVTVSQALAVGDVIYGDMYDARALWFTGSSTTTRPSPAPATATGTGTSSVWSSVSYTVQAGDALVGQTSFNVWRGTSNNTYFSAIRIERSATPRTFKSGEIIYFKDYSSNMSTLGGSTHWKNGSGNVYAKFYDASAKTWTYCASYADLVSGSWNGDNAIYKIIVPGSSKTYTKVIFTRGTGNTDGSTWNKTVEQTPEIGKNMFIIADSKSGDDWTGSWSKYAPNGAVIGDFNDWDPDKGALTDGRVILELEASTDYELKVLVGDGTDNTNYWSCSLCSKATNTTTSWQQLYSNQDNWSMTSGEAGEYCFHWDNTNHYLGIYYPQARFAKNKYIYFDARSETNWQEDGFASRFWFKYYDTGSAAGDTWCAKANALEDWVFYTTVPNDDYVGQVQVNRYSAVDGTYWNDANISYAYARTSSKENCMVAPSSGWSGIDLSWDTYCPPTNKPTLTDNSTTVIASTSGDGSKASPFIIATSGTIKVSAAATQKVNDGNMTKKFDFESNGTSKQNGTGTTYDYTIPSTNDVVYKMTVKAYNNYNSTDGTKTVSDTVYYRALTPRDVEDALTNVTRSSGAVGTGVAANNQPYTATFTASTGYDLPTTITVKIGSSNKTVGTDYTWTVSDGVGTLNILADKINGKVKITITGVAQTYNITYKDGGNVAFTGYHMPDAPTTHTYGTATTLKKASKSGYVFGGWFDNSSCTGDALTTIGATAKTADFTLYAKWTELSLVDLVSGTFYGASDMVPDGITISSTERWYPGVSVDKRFNLLGVGTSEDSEGGTSPMSSETCSSKDLTNAEAVTKCLHFKGPANVTSYVPSSRAIQFKIPAAGQLEVWATSPVYLSDGSAETSINSAYKVVTVSAGTYYIYAKGTSKNLYGLRYKKTHSVSAVTSTGDDTKGTVSASPTVVAEDSASTITAVPATGYQVTNWAVSGTGSSISPNGSSSSTTTTLTMGTADATVTVTFGDASYGVTHTLTNATKSSGGTTATHGTNYTAVFAAADGYSLPTSITVTIGGETATEDTEYTWDKSTGTVEIEGSYITGAIVITVTGTASCSAPSAPSISGTQIYAVGDDIELTATCASGADGSTTYTWYKGADWATASASSPVQAAATGSSGYTLTIEDCTTDDIDLYWCEASNGVGCTSHNTTGYSVDVPLGAHTLTWNLNINKSESSIGTASKASTTSYISNTTGMTDLANYGSLTITGSAKANLTSKIAAPTSFDEGKYMYVTFTIPSGYQFTPSSVSVKAQPVSGAGDVKLILSDANSHSINKTQSNCAKGEITTVTMTNGSSVVFVGTVTLKIYCYGSSTGTYRLGSPITISGTVEAFSGYTVTYDGNGNTGGSVPVDANSPYDPGDEVTVLGNTGSLVKTSSTFRGWTDGTTFFLPGQKFEITSDVTLTAVWDGDYNVSFDDMSGFDGSSTLPSTITGVPSGKKIVQPADPTAEHYIFVGWYKEAACTNAWNFASDVVSAATTLYAKWKPTYTVTWMVNGSEYTTGDPTTESEGSITTLPTAPADNTLSCADSFRGWSTTNLYGESGQAAPASLFVTAADAPSITKDTVFYAVFGDAVAADETSFTTTFTSKSWEDDDSKWNSGKDGYQKNATQGVQVSTSYTGANASTKAEYKAVSEVVVTYSTNSGSGAGSIEIKVGGTAIAGDKDVTKTGGTEDRTITYTPATSLDGKVKITVNTTDGSIYIKSVEISHSGTFENYRCICPTMTVTPKLVTASTPIFITSAANKTVRSQDSLLIVGSGLSKSTAITLSATNGSFALKSRTNGVISTDATGSIDTVAYIYYTPGAGDTSDGLDKNANFTVSVAGNGAKDVTVSQALIGRHVPANFVIAAKGLDDKWYLLPANMDNSNPAPVEINVRNDSVLIPEDHVYTLYQQTTTVINGGNGQYIKLAMHGISPTGGSGHAPLFGSATGASKLGRSGNAIITNDQDVNRWWGFTQTNTSVSDVTDVKYLLYCAANNKPVTLYNDAAQWGLYASGTKNVQDIRLFNWIPNHKVFFADGNLTPASHTAWPETVDSVLVGAKISAPTTPTASGYTFVAWYKDAACTSAWNFASDIVTKDTTLYAKWTGSEYNITYHLNGASWVNEGEATYTSGVGYTLPVAGDMSNPGYSFGGWYANSDLSTGGVVTAIGISETGDKEFWAKWTENTYTITYNANGGSGSTSATVGHYVTVADNGFTAPSGKTFVEWNTLSTGLGSSYNEGDEIELTANMNLYAIWGKSVGTINWTVTKIDSKLYRGGGGYTIKAEIDDASWDASDADSSKLVLTASEGVVLRNIAKSINASGKAQITAKFDITTDVNANATKITFTLNVPENNGYAPLADDHNENLDNCGGGASGYVEFFSMIPTANTCSITNTQAYTASNNYTTCECTSSATITTGGSVTFGLYSSGSGTTNKYWEYSSKNGGWKHSIANTWVVLYSTDPFVAGDSIVITNGNSSSTGYYTIVAAASNNTADYHSASQVVAPSTTSPAKNTNYYYILPGSFVSSNYLVIRSSTSSNCYVGTIKAYHAASKGGESPTLTWDTDLSGGVAAKTGDADFTHTVTQNKNSLGAITYSSSNTSVATVNATTGKVHIVGGGSATITATIAESGCYEEATATYNITVTDNCDDVAGTIEATDLGCDGIQMTVSGHTGEGAGATYQWYKDDVSMGASYRAATCTVTVAGSYYVIVTNTGEGHCSMASTNTVTVTAKETATATKIVDEWYVKNGRRTPDIALVQTEHATGFTVTSGGDLTDIGGCTFELKDDGIIYLHGTKANGDAPSDMTAGDMTITITATGCGGNADALNITIHKQAATSSKSVAFVVEGQKGDAWNTVTSGQADGSALYEYLDSVGTAAGARKFALTECNIYKTNDEKALKQYYSQFDAILITDNPNTRTVPKGVSGDDAYKTKGYVNAFGALIDVRPILTMEAFVSALKNWSNKGVAGNPSSPNPRQYEMRLQCKDHEIYSGLPTPADGTHVWTEIIDGEEYRHVIMVDSTMTPYNKHAYNDSTSQYPALQGFSGEAMGDLLGLGVIANGSLHAGIERQEEPAARLMLLGIQNKALPNALTAEGKRVIANALTYLCKTNMEEVDDCSNFFKGGASGDETNWKNADNWAKSTLPNYETRVRILAPCVLSGTTVKVAQVDIASSGTSSKIEGGTCSGSLTIAADAALIVSGKVRSAEAPHFAANDLKPTELGDLTIKANSIDGNGTLIFDNEDGNTQAIVEMYSKAQNSEGDWSWQYVAVPFNDNSSAYRNYYGSWLYRWAENNSGWEVVPDRGEVYPWVGYCLTQASAKLYSMDGTLVATDEQTFTVGNNQDMVIGNSWTAPIQIKQFDDDDFGGLTKNIYLFNTGLDENGTGSTSGERYAAGTYVVIPIHAASYTGDSLISSLQAFTVANTSGDDATLTLNYDKHVRPARSTDKVNAGIMHAPSRREAESNNPVVLKIWASGSHYDDRLVLLERNDFSTGYDAGWDGEKILIGGASPEMYSLMESGKESVTATDDLEGTIIGFRAGEDSEYTFSFSFDENAEPLYLLDMDNTSYTRILNENTYTFQTTDNAEHQRFVLTRNAPEIITGVTNTQGDIPRARKIIYNDKIYILYNGRIFDAQGKVVK